MTITEITNLFMNAGATVVILAYFIYRDVKFMQKLDSTLDIIVKMIDHSEKIRKETDKDEI